MHPNPKIVVLDGYTLAPPPGAPPRWQDHHDPDWSALQALGQLTVHDRTPEPLVLQHAADAPVVLTNKTPLTAQTIASLPKLRYIGVLATGVNVVDLHAARQHHVTVTNVPAYSTPSVAQHVFALLLELVNHTAAHDQAVRQGRWSAGPDFSFTIAPITELAGKTLGIVGFGAIGRRVAAIAHALGMRIAATGRLGSTHKPDPGFPIAWLPLGDLFAAADVLSLHCPLTEQTHHLVNLRRLALMKTSAILINTGRGPLIDEHALAAALHAGTIRAAGLDVLSTESPTPDNPLLTAPRCLITPHVAWASTEARHRLMHQAAANVHAFLQGKPINVVN